MLTELLCGYECFLEENFFEVESFHVLNTNHVPNRLNQIISGASFANEIS